MICEAEDMVPSLITPCIAEGLPAWRVVFLKKDNEGNWHNMPLGADELHRVYRKRPFMKIVHWK